MSGKEREIYILMTFSPFSTKSYTKLENHGISNLLYCKQRFSFCYIRVESKAKGWGYVGVDLNRNESVNDAITNYIDACCCCSTALEVFGLTHINLTLTKTSKITCQKPEFNFIRCFELHCDENLYRPPNHPAQSILHNKQK